MRKGAALALCALLAAASCTPQTGVAKLPGIDAIQHLIIIYEENRSFDSLYGLFPGANGIANAGEALRQVDKNGQPYATLPQVVDPAKASAPDTRFPANLTVAPFDIAKYVGADGKHPSPAHKYYHEQYQINGGRMDGFLAWTDVGGLAMGYYDGTKLPQGQLAKDYTLSDNFFHSAFGNSFINHFWLVCACTPLWPNAPKSIVAELDAKGVMLKDGQVTPDGFALGTSYTVNTPHPATITDPALLVPSQTMATIGDKLTEKGISWTWYSGGWRAAAAGKPDPSFKFHHQPFAYFAKYADGTAAKAEHLKDEQDFLADLRGGTLPAVSFLKPIGADSEHPTDGNILRAHKHVVDTVNAVQDSAYWKDTLIVITYDENGGFWDHVAPPAGDRWGPGTRVPAIFVSPFAKKGTVDHTRYETVSILRFIEVRWGIAPLGTRDAAADPFTGALELAFPK